MAMTTSKDVSETSAAEPRPTEIAAEPIAGIATTEAPLAPVTEAPSLTAPAMPRAATLSAPPPAPETAIDASAADTTAEDHDVAAPAGRPARRFPLLAASIAVAAGLGAIGGSLGAATVGRLMAPAPAVASDDSRALKAEIAQLRTTIKSLGDSVAALRTTTANAVAATHKDLTRVSESIDRHERAGAEPAARLAKAVDMLQRMESRMVAGAAGPDITGSVAPAAAPPQRPAIVDGWSIRRVNDGLALLQGRMGMVEVEPGDSVPGIGRVQEIKRHEGRWVVVTPKGWIVAR